MKIKILSIQLRNVNFNANEMAIQSGPIRLRTTHTTQVHRYPSRREDLDTAVALTMRRIRMEIIAVCNDRIADLQAPGGGKLVSSTLPQALTLSSIQSLNPILPIIQGHEQSTRQETLKTGSVYIKTEKGTQEVQSDVSSDGEDYDIQLAIKESL